LGHKMQSNMMYEQVETSDLLEITFQVLSL
jgi:hypothetical protein